MKDLVIWLIITTVMVFIGNLYAEYCVSRECAIWISSGATIIVAVIGIWYIKYTVELIMKHLKLK